MRSDILLTQIPQIVISTYLPVCTAYISYFVERTGGLQPWMTKQERRRARKDKRKRRRTREKAPELLGKEDEPDDVIRSPYTIGFGRRLGRLFAATLVAGGLAFGIGVVSQDAEPMIPAPRAQRRKSRPRIPRSDDSLS